MPICDKPKHKTNYAVSLAAQKENIFVYKPSEHSIKNLIKSWDGKRYIAKEINWGDAVGNEMW